LNKKTLITKINTKKGIVGIIGLGYVGLPLAVRFTEVGFDTYGFDIDEEWQKVAIEEWLKKNWVYK